MVNWRVCFLALGTFTPLLPMTGWAEAQDIAWTRQLGTEDSCRTSHHQLSPERATYQGEPCENISRGAIVIERFCGTLC